MKSSVLRTGVPSHIICNCNYNSSQGMCEHVTYNNAETNNNIYPQNINNMGTASDFNMTSTSYKQVGNSDVDSGQLNPVNGLDEGSYDLSTVYQGEWPINKRYWGTNEENPMSASSMEAFMQQDTCSIMSFDSSMTASSTIEHAAMINDQRNSRADLMIRNTLLSMLQTHDKMEVSRLLLEMSCSPENCIIMMEPGSNCLPLLVEMIHERNEKQTFTACKQSAELRERATQILHNIVCAQVDDKKGRREARVLRLLEQVRKYCDFLRQSSFEVCDNDNARYADQNLVPTVAALMKLSFDEEHRHAMCLLGGLQALAELIEVDQEVNGCTGDQYCITIRRYSGMALTNLTFGDGTNKALLCSMKPFMQALVAQLYSSSEELRQVSASVLRNLSWRADRPSKKMLREIGSVSALMKAAITTSKESTLRSILSALWNLSAHCSENKAELCRIDGALGFLVSTLSYKSGSKNLAVVENGGGILRNISSHIALQNEYRSTLRKHNCLQTLLHHLKSPSLTVVSNACGTLWNLSARNPQDQRTLWEMGAVGMLKKLMNSKHKMISMGSSAALKNLLSAMPPNLDGTSPLVNEYNNGMPSLHVRKQKILNAEIDQNLAETYDNTDSPKSSPTNHPQRRSNTNRSRPSSLPRHCIPQRVTEKQQTIPRSKSDNRSENSSNFNSESVQQKANNLVQNFQTNTKSNIAQNGIANRSKQIKGTQKYTNHNNVPCPPNNSIKRTSNVSCKQPVAQTQSSNISKPYQLLSKNQKTFPPNVPSQQTFNRPALATGKISVPSQNKKLPNSANNYNNLAQNMKNIKLEDNDTEERPTTSSSKYSDESFVASNSLSHNSSSKTSVKSKIPMPRLYEDVRPVSSASTVPIKEHVQGHRNIQQKNEESVSNIIITACNPYAETDLDQLVNYSQKYKEGTKEECKLPEMVQPIEYYNSFLNMQKFKANPPKTPGTYGDTVKTYCSKQTPVRSISLDKNCEVSPQNFNSASTKVSSINTGKQENTFVKTAVGCGDKTGNDETKVHHVTHVLRDKEDKNVKFNKEVNSCEETPLMFSRNSSLASLGSFDQQSTYDDKSPVSDVSRLTSGVISPSELPDSPSQTMPSSPVRKKSPELPDPKDSKSSNSEDADGLIVHGMQSDKSERRKANIYLASDAVADANTSFHSTKMDVVGNIKQRKAYLKDESHYSSIEGTSQYFSAHSSLSSLSVDSTDEVLSKEKVILEECIKLGMPKRKKLASQLDASATSCQEKSTEPSNFMQLAQNSKESIKKQNLSKIPKIQSSCVENGSPRKSNLTCSQNSRIVTAPTYFSNETLDDLDEMSQSDNELLQECIKLGMPKRRQSSPVNSSKLSGRSSTGKTNTDTKSLPATTTIRVQPDLQNKSSDSQPKEIAVLNDSVGSKAGLDQKIISDEALLKESLSLGMPKKMSVVQIFDNFTYGKQNSGSTAKLNSSLDNHSSFSNDERNAQKFERKSSDEAMNEKLSQIENNDCLLAELSYEAQKFTEDMMEAVIDSTEDMTVSTLSCLSDIDNMQPPSIMGELVSLSLNNSSNELEQMKGNKISHKESLLKRLQLSRLCQDMELPEGYVKNKLSSSTNSLDIDSSSTTDIVEHINPPSILDNISFTGSTGSLNSLQSDILDSKSDDKVLEFAVDDSSMNERLCEAAAMVQMYTKEFTNITGNFSNNSNFMSLHSTRANLVNADTQDDCTEPACDTICSDVEFVDDLPCDDEEIASETWLAPQLSSLTKDDPGEGSTENLTVTLTEDPLLHIEEEGMDAETYTVDMDQYEVLRENADLILNSLKRVNILDNSEFGGLPANDMLEDETLSLVSNESDDDDGHSNGVFESNDS